MSKKTYNYFSMVIFIFFLFFFYYRYTLTIQSEADYLKPFNMLL